MSRIRHLMLKRPQIAGHFQIAHASPNLQHPDSLMKEHTATLATNYVTACHGDMRGKSSLN